MVTSSPAAPAAASVPLRNPSVEGRPLRDGKGALQMGLGTRLLLALLGAGLVWTGLAVAMA